MVRIALSGVTLAIVLAQGAFGIPVSTQSPPRSGEIAPAASWAEVVSPLSDPRTVAARLAARPAGRRSLFMSGFDYDIASRDRVVFPASRSRSQVALPSPWLSTGPAQAEARIARWLRLFRQAGGNADEVVFAAPPVHLASTLASGTFSSLSRLSTDRRFAAIAASEPGFAADVASGRASMQAWRSILQREVEAASRKAHSAAIRSAMGSLAVRVGTPPVPAAAPSAPAAVAASPSTPAPATAPGGSPSQGSASRSVAEVTAAITSARSFLAQRGMPTSDPQSALLARTPVVSSWDRLFQLADTNAEARRILDFAVASADAVSRADPVTFRRPITFAEIPQDSVDALALNAGANRDARALAMSDCRQADMLRRDGVTLALAVRRAGKPEHVGRMLEMLEEVSRWSPFQRQGWSLDNPNRVLPEGGDGVGMATSWAVIGVVDIMAILGDRIPQELRGRLEAALHREIGNVVDSWVNARPWYVRSDTSISNQWIDPNSAVVLACLHLRNDELRPIYDLAVGNLARSLDALQPDGAFLEGMAYAQMSLPALFRASGAMSAAGDRRLADKPFTQNSWRWMMHMQMPGGNVVSSGDCRLSVLPPWAVTAPLDSFALAAVAAGTPEAVGSLRSLFPNCGIWGSAAAYASPLMEVAPRGNPSLDAWAFFPSQQMVTWREAWTRPSDSSRDIGIWVKGGSLLERSHGHRDQGHVSVFRGTTPILMERGTSQYGDPAYLSEFASARGHGIMQVDPVEPPNAAVNAPLTVDRLDPMGGKVRIDSTAAYRTAQRCTRTVTWDARGSMAIEDVVSLRESKPAGTEFFRFHVGATVRPQVTPVEGGWVVEWDAARIRVTSDAPISVSVTPSVNALREPFIHHVLAVRSATPGSGMALTTELTVFP